MVGACSCHSSHHHEKGSPVPALCYSSTLLKQKQPHFFSSAVAILAYNRARVLALHKVSKLRGAKSFRASMCPCTPVAVHESLTRKSLPVCEASTFLDQKELPQMKAAAMTAFTAHRKRLYNSFFKNQLLLRFISFLEFLFSLSVWSLCPTANTRKFHPTNCQVVQFLRKLQVEYLQHYSNCTEKKT